MSELKAYKMVDEKYCTDCLCVIPSEVYLKSEADKVIAELEMKLAIAQQVLRLNKPEALYSNLETMSRLTHEKYVIERRECHQKYRRCLAMANYWGLVGACTHGLIQLKCMRRELKFRKLADKFKEAK